MDHDSKKWMAALPDEAPLLLLDLVGSHDTLSHQASSLWAIGYYKCQNKNVKEQLEWGVRLMDIRLKIADKSEKKHKDDTVTKILYGAHGGDTFNDDELDETLNDCLTFLKENPTETIVWIVKDEDDGERDTGGFEWGKAFWSYLKDAKIDYVKTGSSYNSIDKLTLGACRGKLVLLQRQCGFGTGGDISHETAPPLTDFEGNWGEGVKGVKFIKEVKLKKYISLIASINIQNKARHSVYECFKERLNDGIFTFKVTGWIQDYYDIAGDESMLKPILLPELKTNQVLANMALFGSSEKKNFILNFASCSFKLDPVDIWKSVAANLKERLAFSNGHAGWCFFDFVGGDKYKSDYELRDQIISANFHDPRWT